MLESVILLLVWIVVAAIVVYLVLHVLSVVGISLPGKVVQLIWLAFALIVLLLVVRWLLGAGGFTLPLVIPWS